MPYLALTLIAAQLLLILVSWIWSAAMPMSGVRSMLSSEGIRWFLGHFAHMLATPLLMWLLLLAMSWGVLRDSGLLQLFAARRDHVRGTQTAIRLRSYRQRRAVMLTALFLLFYIAVVLLLTVVPHAVLLSATGSLWPSPFSASLVPVIAFGILLCSIVFGVVAGRYESLQGVYCSLLSGIRSAAPLLLFYVLFMQFYESLCYVLPLNHPF